MSTKAKLDQAIEHNIGESLMKRFRSEDTKELDLGNGDIIKLKIPKTFSEYSNLLEQAKTRYTESGQTDENYIYVYLIESVVTNLSNGYVEQIVFECPGLCDLILKTIDSSSGNVITRLEAEALEAAKKK